MHEKTLNTKEIYKGKIVHLEVVEVEMPDGSRSTREVIRHRGAAVVLAMRPDRKFIFVRQFRKPLDRLLIEAVAGTLEPGEDPRVCAERELQEEGGYKAVKIHRLGTVYPSPGYVQERMDIFFAQTGMEPVGQKLDADELVQVELFTAAEFNGMIKSGLVVDAKTLAAWLLLEKQFPEGVA